MRKIIEKALEAEVTQAWGVDAMKERAASVRVFGTAGERGRLKT